MNPNGRLGAAIIRRPTDVAVGIAISASILCLIHRLALLVLIAGPVSALLLFRAACQRRIAVFGAGLMPCTQLLEAAFEQDGECVVWAHRELCHRQPDALRSIETSQAVSGYCSGRLMPARRRARPDRVMPSA